MPVDLTGMESVRYAGYTFPKRMPCIDLTGDRWIKCSSWTMAALSLSRGRRSTAGWRGSNVAYLLELAGRLSNPRLHLELRTVLRRNR